MRCNNFVEDFKEKWRNKNFEKHIRKLCYRKTSIMVEWVSQCPLTPTHNQSWHTRTHTHTFPTPPPTAQVRPLDFATTPFPHPPVARQHLPCADTHLPSGFSALNLVLIANWVGEQADAGWMRSRQPRLRLWPRRRLSRHEVTETVGWQTKAGVHRRKGRDVKFRLSVLCGCTTRVEISTKVWTHPFHFTSWKAKPDRNRSLVKNISYQIRKPDTPAAV